jgi:hypothetical protein
MKSVILLNFRESVVQSLFFWAFAQSSAADLKKNNIGLQFACKRSKSSLTAAGSYPSWCVAEAGIFSSH